MANHQIQRERACRQCGKSPILGYKYCSLTCGQTARDRAKGVKPRAARSQCECVVCGTSFGKRSDASLCCSRECGFKLLAWRAEQNANYKKAKTEFTRWARNAKRAAKEAERVNRSKQCRTCGTPVSKGQQRCGPCRSNARSASRSKERSSAVCKASRRAAKARRRAVERSIHAERFDPLEVLNRDKWTCHICGIKTPKRLRGSYDDCAPELDHIIPLAAGGAHTRQNTACACRRCNHKKGDKPLGQLWLIAA